MVTRTVRIILGIAAFSIFAPAGVAKESWDYRPGEVIREDIVTPIPLQVVDPEATEALRAKEAGRIPVVLRYDLTAVDDAEQELREIFARNRTRFLDAIEEAFQMRRLNEATIASQKFERLVSTFRRQNGFPLTTNLAALWASGDSGRSVQAALVARLRETMKQPIRHGAWPPALKLSPKVRLVPISNRTEKVTLKLSDARGFNVPRTNLLILGWVRTNLASRFAPEDQDWAKFLAARLRANCFVDSTVTQQARERHAATLLSTDNYEAGQTIARAGQLVDAKVFAALTELRDRVGAIKLQELVTLEQARATQVQRRNRWLAVGFGVASTAFVAVLVWAFRRRRRPMSMLPATIAGNSSTVIYSAGNEPVVMGENAASQNVVPPGISVRAWAQVAGFFREKLVRGLMSQRTQLLDAHESASLEMAELERRLNELRAPLQERLRAYENRIIELEKALAAKGEENRELIKAKIQLTRRQLELERARNRLVLN